MSCLVCLPNQEARKTISCMKAKLLFLIWFILTIATAFIANHYDKFQEQFPYKFQLYHFNPYIPVFLLKFANYDGAHYLHIAHNGYRSLEQSFFPLFPLLISLLSKIFENSYFLEGFFLANICFAIGFYLFHKYLTTLFKNNTTLWILLFLLVFPTSFFFTTVYTEGLFFLLAVSLFYFLQTKKYALAAIVAFLASLTRLVGVFLFIPILLFLVAENKEMFVQKSAIKSKLLGFLSFFKTHPSWILLIVSPILGLLTYMTYLSFSFHDPLSFYHASSAFGVQRSTHVILLPQVYYRYLLIFLTSHHSFTYFVAILEFITFNFVLGILCYDFFVLWKSKKTENTFSLLGLNLFSFANLLLPTLAGSLSSMPRYALLSLSCFVRLGQLQSKTIKSILLTIFIVLHTLLLWLFIQGYFIS